MGKPIGPAAQNQSTPVSTASTSNGIHDEHGRKIVPDIDVKNLKSYRRGEKLLVKARVYNNSPDQVIRVDTSRLLKQKRQHNRLINPGDSHELTLYDGSTPHDENEHEAQVIYRLQANGDVFMEDYRVEYSIERDGARLVEELHDNGPVRDI